MLKSLLPWEKVAEGRMRGGLARPPFAGRQWEVLPSSVRFADSFSPKGEAFPLWEKVAEGRMRGGLARPPLCGAAMESSPLISPLCGQLLPQGEKPFSGCASAYVPG